MKFYIDPKEISAKVENFKSSVEQEVAQEVERLAMEIKAEIDVWAAEELKSSHKKFKDNFKFTPVGENTWIIEILAPALWIEEGITEAEGRKMKEKILKGAKYKVIPFEWSKAPTQHARGQAQSDRAQIMQELQRRKIKLTKMDLDGAGNPITGPNGAPKLIKSFNFGGRIPGKGNTPIMNNVSIYQSGKNGNVKRGILTFRTMKADPDQPGMWQRPEFKGKKFLERAYKLALERWKNEIEPKILDKWK